VFKVGEESTGKYMRKPNATVSDELSVNDMKVFTENEREVFNIEMKGDYYKFTDSEAEQPYEQPLSVGNTGKDISDPNDPRVCIILLSLRVWTLPAAHPSR
jgi:hypothetical protein